MTVSTDTINFLAYHQTDFAMCFISHQAIHHVRSNFFQRSRPGNICFLIKSCLQLDKHRHLFAAFGCTRQSLSNGRGGANSIKGHFDRKHFRIFCRFINKTSHRIKRMVRVKQHNVARAYSAPDIRRTFETFKFEGSRAARNMTINPQAYARFRDTIELFRTSPRPAATTKQESELEIR